MHEKHYAMPQLLGYSWHHVLLVVMKTILCVNTNPEVFVGKAAALLN